MSYDVFGIENPLIDLLVQVPDAFLQEMQLEKNRMFLIDETRHQELLQALDSYRVHPEPGGSCANTLLGITQLGGTAAYCGKVGGDQYGRIYSNKLEEAGVTSFIQANEHLTGSTIILVTPDAARTMNTFLGACQDLGAEDIPLDDLKKAKRLYLTGYLWDTDRQKEAALLALKTAQQENIPVAMSLADPFCVNRHPEDFRDILSRYVDIVFSNQEEALALTETDTTHEALKRLRGWCNTAAITLGSSGALVSRGNETIYLDSFPVHAEDTTGAGDAFAAGFLYGDTNGASLFQSGRLGSYFAANVIQKVGPRLEGDVRTTLSPVLDDPRQ